MASVVLDGEPVPVDGSLPDLTRAQVGVRPFSVYVHVPYCASRCGYCDFNTYTAAELGGGASQAGYAADAIAEIRLARGVLGSAELPVQTVFFGGGTPTLLPPAELAAILHVIDDEFGLAAGAEVTTEANPESIDLAGLEQLRGAGFTRISFGMQSAVPHVLATLDRRHTPGTATRRVTDARSAGFEHLSLDLIYGTPGESDDDWRASVHAVLDAAPDHVSAYSLIVEDGTRLGRQVARGELPMPDDDVLADRYLIADEEFGRAGYDWYEVSNWARPGGACRHNLAYWRGDDWWGVGPGAHSHIAGVRWWNAKHPSVYAGRLAAGASPGQARELLDDQTRRVERVMLALRLSGGLDLRELDAEGQLAARQAADDGLLQIGPIETGRGILTTRGRLLADAVVRALLH
jgi:putative oxygen-independent coproporphyrinogen III oxidase